MPRPSIEGPQLPVDHAVPAWLVYTRKTRTCALSTRPAVPVYWRCIPPSRCLLEIARLVHTSTVCGSPWCSTK
jgi:hypothetical protein